MPCSDKNAASDAACNAAEARIMALPAVTSSAYAVSQAWYAAWCAASAWSTTCLAR